MDDVNKPAEIFFLFLNLDIVFGNSTPGRLAYIWQSEWMGTIVMEIERPRIHF